jgi:hypothetical protein
MPLADTLLRFAEHPRLYLPKWSNHIMEEVTRNLSQRWLKTPEQAVRREAVMREHFPEAWVEGYEALIPAMTNDEKDRHVLACAVRCGAAAIVTYNKVDFPRASLAVYGIDRYGPSAFLRSLYELDPALAVRKLHEQANAISISIEDLLTRMRPNIPGFVDYFCEEQEISVLSLSKGPEALSPFPA